MRLDVDIKSEFFTSREVADGLGISLRTLKNYRDEGRIQYHKFSPRRIVYAKQHIWAFLQTTHCSFYMKEMFYQYEAHTYMQRLHKSVST